MQRLRKAGRNETCHIRRSLESHYTLPGFDRVGDGCMHTKPIFLTGVYRSGTTLVAQVLNNHPRLRIIYDTLHFFRFYLGSHATPEERYEEIVSDAKQRLDRRFGVDVPAERIISILKGKARIEFKDIYETIMIQTFCNGRTDIRWGEKSLLQWTNIPLFLQMFPNGQAIHIIRDPRDVLASYREYTHELPHRYLDAVFCCLHSMKWASTVGRALPADRYLVLRHEDMVTGPGETTRRLCEFLALEYDPIMLDATRFVDQSGSRWSGDSSFGDVDQQIVPVSAGRWRNKLYGFEVMLVESVLGHLLPKFGYEPSGIMVGVEDLSALWDRIGSTPLLQGRLRQWLETGEGVDKYPSDPTDSRNWEKTSKED